MSRRLSAVQTLAVGIVLGLVVPASGGKIEWSHNLKDAAAFASQSRKPLLVKVSATWCGPCKKMARETFADENVVNHVSQCFVPVALDGDRDSLLVRSMGVSAYPTTLIMSSDLNVVKRITGYRSAKQLSKELDGVCGGSHNSPSQYASVRGPVPSPFGEWCPVSPVLDKEFVTGNPAVRATYRGFDLQFRNDQHRQAFFAAPHRYWPAADGNCVVSWLDEQVKTVGQLRFGLEHRGVIWFFASDEHRQRFARTPDEYVARLTGGQRQQ